MFEIPGTTPRTDSPSTIIVKRPIRSGRCEMCGANCERNLPTIMGIAKSIISPIPHKTNRNGGGINAEIIHTIAAHRITMLYRRETYDSQGSDYAYSISPREVPRRAITCLKNLARGHALLTGRNHITLDDIPIIIKTALDTAPIERVSLFSLLIANNGILTTNQILRSLNVARKTALRTMAELKAIGLVDMDDFHEPGQNNVSKRIILSPRFNWFLSDPMITKIIPHTHLSSISEGQEGQDPLEESPMAAVHEETFWQVFEELLKEEEQFNDSYSDVDKNTINGKKLEKRLLSTGEFYNGDAARMIKKMVNAGKLKEVMLDTYRKI